MSSKLLHPNCNILEQASPSYLLVRYYDLEGVISQREEILLDHQLLLDALTEEYLAQVLTQQQAKRFSMLRRASDKAHYFILNFRR